MFARVSTYRGDADRLIKAFGMVTLPLEQLEGFSHSHLLVDRARGKVVSMTVWESREALSASAARANEMRKQASQAGGGSIESVEEYEIAVTLPAEHA